MIESDFGQPIPFALDTSEENLPEWIPILPPGHFVEGTDGRVYELNNPDEIVENFKRRGKIKIDLEHGSVIKASKGEAVDSAGWIVELDASAVKEKGILGKADWTELGAEQLRKKNYRDISPALFVKQGSRSIKEIPSIGLVSIGNFPGLVAMNRPELERKPYMLDTIAKTLGIGEKAEESEILGKIGELLALREAVAAKEETEKALSVRVEELEKALLQKDETLKEVTMREIEAELNSAQSAMKITPATREYYREVCEKSGVDVFRKIMSNTVPVIGGTVELNSAKPESGITLSPLQERCLAAIGKTAEQLSPYMQKGN